MKGLLFVLYFCKKIIVGPFRGHQKVPSGTSHSIINFYAKTSGVVKSSLSRLAKQWISNGWSENRSSSETKKSPRLGLCHPAYRYWIYVTLVWIQMIEWAHKCWGDSSQWLNSSLCKKKDSSRTSLSSHSLSSSKTNFRSKIISIKTNIGDCRHIFPKISGSLYYEVIINRYSTGVVGIIWAMPAQLKTVQEPYPQRTTCHRPHAIAVIT